MRRAILVTVSFLAVLAFLLTLSGYFLLASWVPTKGKALIIHELERRAPIEVSIAAVRHRPLHGFLVEEIQVTERATAHVLFQAPRLTIGIGLWPLIAQRVAFRGQADVEAPCRTELRFAGWYHVRTKQLDSSIHTGDVGLDTIMPPWNHRLPPQLRGGALQLDGTVAWAPRAPLRAKGRITGRNLVWQQAPLQIRTDLGITGTVSAPSSPGGRWTVDAVVKLDEGTVDGLPVVDSITGLQGTGRLTLEGLEIDQLQGTALDTAWTLEGRLAPLTAPHLEALLHGRPQLGRLSRLTSAVQPPITFTGLLETHAVCRGPLQPPLLDCAARFDLHDVTAVDPRLSEPVTGINGRVWYDLLGRQATIDSLQLRLRDRPLTIRGSVRHAQAIDLALQVDGSLDLAAISGLLPPQGPVTKLEGLATVDVAVQGLLSLPDITGDITLHDGEAVIAGIKPALQQLKGVSRLSPGRIELSGFSLVIDDVPLSLSATLTDWRRQPRVVSTIQWPSGMLQLSAKLLPTRILVDTSQLTLTTSQVHLSGDISRQPEQPSALALSGTMELAELNALPFLKRRLIDPAALSGTITTSIQFRGPLNHWTSAGVQGWVKSDRLLMKDVPVERVILEFDQSQGVLRIRVPEAHVAQGTAWSEATIEPMQNGPQFMWRVELTNLQLEALAHSIPAWRQRSVTGSVSGQALITGQWPQRSTWKGEGWLHAQGEHLGDMPLLDRLFGGLFGVLGDRLGLESLRRAHITQASLQWHLLEERFRTEDLKLGGLAGQEPVAVYARGSVGMDQTLDFVIEPEFSEQTVLEAPTTSTWARTVLNAAGQLERLRRLIGRHRLTGTLKQPDYRFEVGPQETLREMAPGTADILQGLFDRFRSPQ